MSIMLPYLSETLSYLSRRYLCFRTLLLSYSQLIAFSDIADSVAFFINSTVRLFGWGYGWYPILKHITNFQYTVSIIIFTLFMLTRGVIKSLDRL